MEEFEITNDVELLESNKQVPKQSFSFISERTGRCMAADSGSF